MNTKSNTTTPAPTPDAQPVQVAFRFGHEDYHSARIAGNWANAAEIAEALSGDLDLHPSIRDGYLAEAARMRAKDALLAALEEAIHEAGRMSSQPRAVYCALIAEDAIAAAKGGAQ